LHTNDACASVTRLLDMGIEPYLLASSLLGVVAQRLVRRVCVECRELAPIGIDALRSLNVEPDTPLERIARARGCPACNGSGYRGRTGIYEVLLLDDALRALIHARAAEAELRAAARARGMSVLREDGWRWLAAGETTLEEVLRATSE
jgi:general secretion pathway protein E